MELNQKHNDTDGDGLNDGLEYMLKTNVTDKYGDKDQDGLYDFEEYLDLYGTPDNTGDTPKYKYNDSSTYGDILDIYHKFGLDSNKAGYLRDTVFTEQNGGFTNYLLWNVSFSGDYAGGSVSGSVSYVNNILTNVTFSGYRAGGSWRGSVSYENNSFINVRYIKSSSGGDSGVSVSGHTSYTNNSFDRVQYAQLAGRRAEYNVSSIGNVIMNDSYDSDGDGLGDIFEFLNGLEPEDSDSDGDGLSDAWEVKYNGSSGVDPLTTASASDLSSDADMDGFSLSEEEELGTDPEDSGTDSDGLNEG